MIQCNKSDKNAIVVITVIDNAYIVSINRLYDLTGRYAIYRLSPARL